MRIIVCVVTEEDGVCEYNLYRYLVMQFSHYRVKTYVGGGNPTLLGIRYLACNAPVHIYNNCQIRNLLRTKHKKGFLLNHARVCITLQKNESFN